MKHFYISLSLLYSVYSYTQNGSCDICEKVIVQDKIQSSTSVYQQIKYYESINEETFNKLKTEASGGGGILKIITASADYSSYQENLRKYKKEVNYEGLLSTSTDYSSITTNPIAYKAWESCIINTCSNLKFNAWIFEERETEVVLKMKYMFDGSGDAVQRVRITTVENGKKTVVDTKVNPGNPIPYAIQRKFDKDGKSNLSISVQPIDKDNNPIYNGLKFSSTYFKPLILLTAINVNYPFKFKKDAYSHSPLSFPDFSEIRFPTCPKMPLGSHSCGDGKYCAIPGNATIIADNGFYFENPSALNLINFLASGPGAAHNQGQYTPDCKPQVAQITQATPQTIVIHFAGTSGLATSWSIWREETKDSIKTVPLIFYYVDKDNVNFSIPLSYLDGDYKISLVTPNVGTFIISKESEKTIPFTDSNGIRYYKLNLKTLLEPSTQIILSNTEMLTKPEVYKNFKNLQSLSK